MHHRICYGKEENLGQQYGYGAAIGLCLHFMKWNIAADAGSGMKFVIVGDKNGFRVIQGFYQLHAVLSS